MIFGNRWWLVLGCWLSVLGDRGWSKVDGHSSMNLCGWLLVDVGLSSVVGCWPLGVLVGRWWLIAGGLLVVG